VRVSPRSLRGPRFSLPGCRAVAEENTRFMHCRLPGAAFQRRHADAARTTLRAVFRCSAVAMTCPFVPAVLTFAAVTNYSCPCHDQLPCIFLAVLNLASSMARPRNRPSCTSGLDSLRSHPTETSEKCRHNRPGSTWWVACPDNLRAGFRPHLIGSSIRFEAQVDQPSKPARPSNE
jgi:hypothetical protein